MTRFRTLSPSGLRIAPGDLVDLGLKIPRSARETEALKNDLSVRLGVPDVVLFSTGRAAMLFLLRVLASRSGPSRDTVVVPGYTCFSVAACVGMAGLRLHPVDIDPDTLDYDKESLETVDPHRILAIISGNLFGAPNDLPWLERYAADRGMHLLDDAAQALGARVDQRPVGAFGAAGILSFDKGKNITAVTGGALLVRSQELSSLVAPDASRVAPPNLLTRAHDLARLVGFAALIRPTRYWLPARVLSLGATAWDTEFEVRGFNPWLSSMVRDQLGRLETITATRQRADGWLRTSLGPSDVYKLPASRSGDSAALRFPVVFNEGSVRDAVLTAMQAQGLGASRYYPTAIIDVPGVRTFLATEARCTPIARRVARGMLTLPTHEFVRPKDVDSMVAIIRKATA